MAWDPSKDRWPPIYDTEELERAIREQVQTGRLEKEFWLRKVDTSYLAQGDLLRLRAGVPVIAADGEPSMMDDVPEWLILGNTCDLERELRELEWSQIVPIVRLKSVDVPPNHQDALRSYSVMRRFYLPSWDDSAHEIAYADLTRIVTVHKAALVANASSASRMSIHGWVVLHACLVRFLARDDGRHAA